VISFDAHCPRVEKQTWRGTPIITKITYC